jgi:hypothetical protein
MNYDLLEYPENTDKKPSFGVITVDQWTAMTLPEKSKLIDDLWQIKGAAESLGAAWNVVRLLTSWGYTVEWIDGRCDDHVGGLWCDIQSGEKPKVDLKESIGYGVTLSESLCAAALRCVGLLALR